MVCAVDLVAKGASTLELRHAPHLTWPVLAIAGASNDIARMQNTEVVTDCGIMTAPDERCNGRMSADNSSYVGTKRERDFNVASTC